MWAKWVALLRAAWAEALVYRAQVLIWVLTGVLPLVMLSAWLSLVGDGAQIAGFSGPDFVVYFLGAIVVRQLTGVWVIWDIDEHIRMGTLSPFLLRPAPPVLRYLALALADKPLRLLVTLPPIALVLLFWPAARFSPQPASLLLLLPALLLAFLIYFCFQLCIGFLAFWTQRAVAVQDFYFGLYAFCSGYLIPLNLFPPAVAQLLDYLPFRALLAFPLGLLLGKLDGPAIVYGFAHQLFWVLCMGGLAALLWQRGLRRYGAVGA